ncbi:DUF1440 domain-containing protein [Fodinicurvata fenggangensis]|uniref:DUF1440 domain-containing protein n=1 Tax=Fodinicurvata fenggangensis TaxID=1121830 RepID=UPI000478CB93|nr:DUF1440 domain-containing protein [Fodinicurvata fenggangensis]
MKGDGTIRRGQSSHSLNQLIGAGVAAGVISALVKSGVETLLPPRLPDAVPPPIGLLELLGFDATGMTYRFSDQVVNWGGNGVHILFSVVIAVIYCLLVQAKPIFRAGQGMPFGLAMGLGAHILVLPIIGVGPMFWTIPFEGYVSEIVGTIIWIWTIECVRRALLADSQSYLRSITH